MNSFQKKSYVRQYFEDILNRVHNKKVKAVFALDSPFWDAHNGYRVYSNCEEIYVEFEDGMCLVIDYLFIDELNVEFRKLSQEEIKIFESITIKDYFNNTADIYDHISGSKRETHICSLQYECIKEIEIRSVTEEYEKWVDDDLDFVEPDSATFDELRFVMTNGQSFAICADDASLNGYVRTWSEDAQNSVQKY